MTASVWNGKGRAGFGRSIVLHSRILSQLMVRPITDSGHRAFETQATNLHPSSFFPLHANWHLCLTLPTPLTTWVSVWLAAIQNAFSSKPWLRPRTHGGGRWGRVGSSLWLCKACSSIQPGCWEGLASL